MTTPGDDAYAVHDVSSARVGLQVYYDWRFPEATRVLALQGADVIAHSTNSPTAVRGLADFLPRTRSVENAVFFLMANRVGREAGTMFFVRSQIIDPMGCVLAEADETEQTLLVADVDLEWPGRRRRSPGTASTRCASSRTGPRAVRRYHSAPITLIV